MSYKLPSQNPFGLYDFIGYFVPGCICIFGISYISEGKVCRVIYKMANVMCREYKLIPELVFLLILITLCYVVGQMIGLLSASFLEKHFFVKIFHYPSHYSLDSSKNKPSFKGEKKRDSIILWVLCVFFLPITLLFMFVLYFKPDSIYGTIQKPLPLEIVKKSVTNIFIKYYKYNEFKFDKEIENRKSNYFQLIYHYALENNMGHAFKFINYIALYGFFRNFSFVLMVLGWSSLIYNFCMICSLLFVLACISFMGFIKFFNRYTREVLYAAAVLINKFD